MTTALEGGEWSAARPVRTLPPGKTRYPLYRRLGGPQGWSGREENLAPPGFDPRTVHTVVAIPTELPGPHSVSILARFEAHPAVLPSSQSNVLDVNAEEYFSWTA